MTESRRVVSRAGRGDGAFPRGRVSASQAEESPGVGAGDGGNGPGVAEQWIQRGGQVSLCVFYHNLVKGQKCFWGPPSRRTTSLGCRQRRFPGALFLVSALMALYLGLI